MISFQFTGLKCMLQLITVHRWSQVLSNVNARCVQLTCWAQLNSMAKSLERESWSHCQQVSFSSHSPCPRVTRVDLLLYFPSQCAQNLLILTSNVFLGAAEVIFGEIFTCFFAWYKKLGCDNADNDDQNVDKQDDDQIWSDGEVLVWYSADQGKVDWLRRPQAAPFNETPSHPPPPSSSSPSIFVFLENYICCQF